MSNRVRYNADFWRQTIESQENSNSSVADFCQQHQLKTVTFYRWRKRLHTRSLAEKQSDFCARAASTRGPTLTTFQSGKNGLVELVVDANAKLPERSSEIADSPRSLVEVSLEGGTLIRIHGYAEPQAIGHLVACVRNAGSGRKGR